MFEVGEAVFYGLNGICRIEGIEDLVFSGKKDKYYILKPEKGGSTYFVPLSSELLVGKMRRLLSAGDIADMLSSDSVSPCEWEENDKKRKLMYKEALSEGNVRRLISILDSIHLQKRKTDRGKKGRVLALDEGFLRDAGRVICDEFSYILGIPQADVIAKLTERLDTVEQI